MLMGMWSHWNSVKFGTLWLEVKVGTKDQHRILPKLNVGLPVTAVLFIARA